MYCVFNANMVISDGISHVRQMKEDKQGKRYPLAKNKQAIIRKKDGLYYGIINKDEVIAISDDVETVYKRLSLVDRDIDIVIRHKNRSYKSIESYRAIYLPRIYRMSYSEAGGHDLIIALDYFKNGDYSRIHMFYDFDDVIKFIKRKQRNDNNFIIFGRRPSEQFDKEVGGLSYLEVGKEYRTTRPLSQAVKERQRAGSHEAYIEKVKKEQAKIRFGDYSIIGEEPEHDDIHD